MIEDEKDQRGGSSSKGNTIMTNDDQLGNVIDAGIALLDYCEKQLQAAMPRLSGIDLVGMFLISRVLELSRAAIALLRLASPTPVAIAILARAQLESTAALSEILDSKASADDREERAQYFLKFGEYKQVSFLREDLDAYRASLDDAEKNNLDRRVSYYRDVEATFSEAQKKQGRFPTWNGKSITQMIREHFGHGAGRWYALMCLISHGDPSMSHKSLTLDDEGFMLCQRDYGTRDATDWVRRMNNHLFVALGLFLARHGEVEPDHDGILLAKQLGFEIQQKM